MGGIENGIGLEIILWFQSWRSGAVEAFFLPFHFLGSADFYLMAIPLIYWCFDADFGRKFGMVFLAGMWSNGVFKEWWKRPRPAVVSDKVQPAVDETSYGLPSGHAQGATLFAAPIAYRVKRPWVTAVAILYIVLMMLSRMVLGAHFPQDVVAGMLIGLVWLAVLIWVEPPLSAWLEGQSIGVKIGLSIAAGVVMYLIYPVLITPSSVANAETAITTIGAFVGGGIGFALEVQHVRFDAGGLWWKRLLRLVVGIVLIMAVRYGLAALFEMINEAVAADLEITLRLIRYLAIGWVLAFGAPWVFVKTGLAGKRSE